MKAKQLLEAFSHIDDRHLETAERTARRGRTVFCAAACLCAVAALVFILTYPSPVPPEDAVSSEAQTSEKYEDLDSLIKALSSRENHDNKDSEGVRSSLGGCTAGTKGAESAVSFAGYTYSVSEDFTLIVTNENGEIISEQGEAQSVMLAGDQLVAFMPFMSDGTELDYEMSVAIEIYSLANPTRPLLERRMTQRGNLVVCYESRGQILVLTEDGECACGASARDKEMFIPLMTVCDEPLEWTDDEISILGEPQSVRYLAVSAIDPSVGEVTVKRAYYGDIESVFCGEDWIAITTAISGSGGIEHPQVYTFDYDNGFVFTGKLSTAAIFSLPESVRTDLLGGLRDGTYPAVCSVTKEGSEYRVIGELAVVDGGRTSTEMFALRADIQAQTHTFVRTKHSDGEQFSIAEIL
ncbi:MAG: beta-propeller domain-containing protein, partial [Clostridia bacterium]|nr:beta-propeller domain-containing protein [Clostridia bacterium]